MKLLNSYKKLKKREQFMVLVFITAITALLYYQLFYKPLAKDIRTYVFQVDRLKTRLEEVRAKFPEVYEKEAAVKELDEACDKLLTEIEELEKKIPSRQATSRLIGELTRLAEGMKLESVRQKVDTGEEYSRIFVEITFDAPYKEIVRYIKRVETISPFLQVEEFEVTEPRRRKKKKSSARLIISSLLGDRPFSEQLRAGQIDESLLEFRDIFVSKVKPILAVRKIDIELEGITYNAGVPTCIIKGEVMREGEEVDGLIIKKILHNTVILTDNTEEYVLTIER